jgi:hypothetical protein
MQDKLKKHLKQMTKQTRSELEAIMSLSRILPDTKMTEILDELQNEQPIVYEFIYGEPSDAINLLNRDMANLYLDLSFDVVWMFREKFGKLPMIENHEIWVTDKLALLDAELISLTKAVPMNTKIRSNLQRRFVKRSIDSAIQLELLQYLEDQVENYVSFNKKREKASQLTKNLLFVLVRLFGDLYAYNRTSNA